MAYIGQKVTHYMGTGGDEDLIVVAVNREGKFQATRDGKEATRDAPWFDPTARGIEMHGLHRMASFMPYYLQLRILQS